MSEDHKTASFCAQQKEIFPLDLSDARQSLLQPQGCKKTPQKCPKTELGKREHTANLLTSF